MITAIIPSSGKSKRMGQPKGLLKINGKSLLDWQIESLLNAGISQIIVVGPAFLAEHATSKAQFIDSQNIITEMIGSVRLGLTHVSDKTEGILIVPSDFPMLNSEIVDFILWNFQKDKSKIIVPSFNGKGGHPVLIPRRFFNQIKTLRSGEGLRGLIKENPGNVTKVKYRNNDIHLNINTPEDFEKFKQQIKQKNSTIA